jgi:SagB-type dehydrogenase family enzyme
MTQPAYPDIERELLERSADERGRALEYHEGTKLTPRSNHPLGDRVQKILNDPDLHRLFKRAYKTYPSCDRIALPRVELGERTVEETLLARRSQLVAYEPGTVPAAALSALLRYSYGPTHARRLLHDGPGELTLHRATASAGGLYPLELYPFVFDVDGVEPGLYHYDVGAHALEALAPGPCRDDVLARMSDHELVRTSAALIAITAVLPRTLTKYLYRGYRFVLYDVGALVESMYLAATAAGVGACAVGGYFDDELGALLGIDNVDEHVMALFSIGRANPMPLRLVVDAERARR